MAAEGDPRKKAFDLWDKDKSETIEQHEVTDVLTEMYKDSGIDKTAEDIKSEAERMLSRMDLNSDGKVTWEEFKKAIGGAS